MKRKSFPASVKWGCLAMPLALVAPYGNAADFTTAVQAKQCSVANNTCPYPSDLKATDAVYKSSMEKILNGFKMGSLLKTGGELVGVETPLEPVQAFDMTWLKSTVCEPGNCGGHYFTYIYQPEKHVLLGYYFDGTGRYVGKPTLEVAAMLRGEAMPAAPAAQNTVPADTIWNFTAKNGDVLWNSCGGKQSSCVIVGNTKHIVAVLNHKSASGCALGDFYIVDRDTRSWQQRDTGTCSPNAWVRKGSINGGQYLSVDIGVGDETVIQYPIGYWSDQKEFSGPNRPSWEKAKQAAKQ
ncbi:hypothetical protein ACM26M_19050 [Kluyvera cryocrescens]|uniref:hypothetical protein n=1 Tax=Kluyvera cryocrescens TaxID=580 RepID=UPI0039F6B29D